MELTSDIVLQTLPKLLVTHTVDLLANDKCHVSILALRRLVNFIRLFKLCVELVPETRDAVNEKMGAFRDEPGKRVKEFTPSLGDILAYSVVSDQMTMMDILEPYLEEQLDRQAFWILQ